MIVLYRRKESSRADEIQARLEGLVVAHRVVYVEDGRPEELPPEARLPAIGETGELHSGDDSIRRFFDELEQELTSARIYSADACYVNPKDPRTCI